MNKLSSNPQLNNPRHIVWFSCGIASTITAYFVLKTNPEAFLVYCDTGSEHPDNKRFLNDCQNFFKTEIIILKSEKYNDLNEVINKKKYMSGIKGAPCTIELKKIPRQNFSLITDINYFGYTFDEFSRAERFLNNNPELRLKFPLIDLKINKSRCFEIFSSFNIKIPEMYNLGFEHNNCIGCVKSASPKYWSMIKENFPEIFQIRLQQSKKLNVKLLQYKNKRLSLADLDKCKIGKLKENHCDFLCH